MRPFRSRRRGLALVPALVCLIVVGLIGGAILRQALTQRRTVRDEQRRAQADWLVESGLDLAAARLAADPNYPGETWTLPAEALGGLAGSVTIAVEPVANQPSRRRVRATAATGDPAGDVGRVKQSGAIILELPPETPKGSS